MGWYPCCCGGNCVHCSGNKGPEVIAVKFSGFTPISGTGCPANADALTGPTWMIPFVGIVFNECVWRLELSNSDLSGLFVASFSNCYPATNDSAPSQSNYISVIAQQIMGEYRIRVNLQMANYDAFGGFFNIIDTYQFLEDYGGTRPNCLGFDDEGITFQSKSESTAYNVGTVQVSNGDA